MNDDYSSQTQVNLNVQLEHVKNPVTLYGDKETVEGLIKRVCIYFENTGEPLIHHALQNIKTPPLTLEKCKLLRIIIDERCQIVPDELNVQEEKDKFGKTFTLILVAKVLTLKKNEVQQLAKINLDSLSIDTAKISTSTQTQIVAVAQCASDSLDNYIKTLEKSVQFNNRRMTRHSRSQERDVLIPRSQLSNSCCTII